MDYAAEFDENLIDEEEQTAAQEVSFPGTMLAVAILFDLVGIIPLLNIFTEILAGLIFFLWQKSYTPKTDPVLSFIFTKIIDFASFGIFPSNTAIVVYAYMKKKAASKIK